MSCGKDGTYIFTREQVRYLITLYENHPILYEVTNDQYKNKTKRNMAFVAIREEFNKKFLLSNVSIEDIRKKINNLRTQYFAELNKVKKSMVSGIGTEEIYQPTLWCYDLITFLNTGNPVRESISTLTMNNEKGIEEELEVLYEGEVDDFNTQEVTIESPLNSPPSRPSTSTSTRSEETRSVFNKRKRSTQSDKAVAIMEKATKMLERNEEPSEKKLDIIDAFLVTVGAELRELKSPLRCRRVRRRLDLIYEEQNDEGRAEEK